MDDFTFGRQVQQVLQTTEASQWPLLSVTRTTPACCLLLSARPPRSSRVTLNSSRTFQPLLVSGPSTGSWPHIPSSPLLFLVPSWTRDLHSGLGTGPQRSPGLRLSLPQEIAARVVCCPKNLQSPICHWKPWSLTNLPSLPGDPLWSLFSLKFYCIYHLHFLLEANCTNFNFSAVDALFT